MYPLSTHRLPVIWTKVPTVCCCIGGIDKNILCLYTLFAVEEMEPPTRYRSHAISSSPVQLRESSLCKPQISAKYNSPRSPKLRRRPHVNKTKPTNITRGTSPVSPNSTDRPPPSINIHAKQIEVEKYQNEFGFAVRGIRVYMKNSNNFQTDHLATVRRFGIHSILT